MVKHFLLVYDRPKGKLLSMTEIAGRAEALQARFDAEKRYRDEPSIEVVVLSAASEADIRRTHARYFEDLGELARGLARQMDEVRRGIARRIAEPPATPGAVG